MDTKEYHSVSVQPDTLFLFLIAGLIAFAEKDWNFPYPSTLTRARGLLTGAAIEKGEWQFQSMADFLRMVQTPLRHWWPLETYPSGADPDTPLLNPDFQIDAYVEEILLDLDDLSRTQKFQVEQLKMVLDNRKIRTALLEVKSQPHLQNAYVSMRRFIIENPWVNMDDGNPVPYAARPLMEISDYYEPPSPNMYHGGKLWLCPRCKGILIWANNKPRCATAGLCEYLTHFDRLDSASGDIRTLKLTFRKRVQLPGRAEIQLFDELRQIPGVEVELWPNADLFDLSVRKGEKLNLALDVKDYTSPYSLSALINRLVRPPFPKGVEFLYVIPDYRRQLSPDYLERLKRLLPSGQKVCFVSDILRKFQKSNS